MSMENDESIELSLSQKDTLTHQPVAEIPGPDIPPVPPTPKNRSLERLTLHNATSTMMRLVRGIHLETDAYKRRRFSPWHFKKFYLYVMTDSLYKNSIFNIVGTFVLGGLGFFFWIIIARLYKPEYVGIATTLISIMTFLSGFTILGLDSSLIRYLPKSANKSEVVNSSFVIVAIVALLATAIFLLGLQAFSPKLLFIRSNVFFFLSFTIFVIFCSWNVLVDNVFLAFRNAGNILIKNIIISVLKLLLPFALIALGAYGIFTSAALGLTLGVLSGLFILIFKFNIKPSISVNFSFIKEKSIYSTGNYIAVFMRNMPSLILPVIILNILSAKDAAYFYVAFMVQNVLLVIAVAAEQSLLAEGSHNEYELKKHVKKASAMIFVILVPMSIIIVLFGNILLQFFGKNYATEAFQLLQLYAVSTIFTALLLIACAILNVKQKIKTLVITNIAAAVLTLSLSYAFISHGLVGIGWGWVAGQAMVGLVSIYLIIRNCSGTPQSRMLPSTFQEVRE
jgi:O-antigen/teichoic acid export membrane protein